MRVAINSEQLHISALHIVTTLREHGYAAYYVGGCVRDMIMKRSFSEIDIATSARPEEVMRIFKRTVPVGAQFGVVIVLDQDMQFEVATFRNDGAYVDGRHPESVTFSSPEEDAQRRDFTINGLFWDPVEEKIIDFVNGRADIDAHVIRAIGAPEKRFQEDKLRMLRAVRFAARFNMPIEQETFACIQAMSGLIHEVSAERIRDELVKMMTDESPARSLQLLDETGLLVAILPEVAAMKGVEQPPQFHPEGDVYVHTMIMMEMLSCPNPVLAFATLLHDIGKPRTMKITDRIRFSGHDVVGAKMAEDMLRRLRFSNKDIDAIVQCIRNHMNIMHVQQMRVGKLKRLMAADTFASELELHRIDCASSHGMLDNYHFLCGKIEAFKDVDIKPKPLVSGHDLIALGMTPSPVFKDILNEGLDLQLEGVFNDRDAALAWLAERASKERDV